MDTLLIIGKVILSAFLACFLYAGILKAHPKTHNPEIRPFAEYAAGFLISGFSLVSLYWLWF